MTNMNINQAYFAARKKISNPVKNKFNPHFKSNFADLNAVYDACQDALTEQNIILMQPMDIKDGFPVVITRLIHVPSGETMESFTAVPNLKGDANGFASGITYCRRYGLTAMLGLCSDEADDDGAIASGITEAPKQRKETPKAVEAPAEKTGLNDAQKRELTRLLDAKYPEKVQRNEVIRLACEKHKIKHLGEMTEQQYNVAVSKLKDVTIARSA